MAACTAAHALRSDNWLDAALKLGLSNVSHVFVSTKVLLHMPHGRCPHGVMDQSEVGAGCNHIVSVYIPAS